MEEGIAILPLLSSLLQNNMPRIAVLFEYPTLLGGERSLLAAIERLRDRFRFAALAPEQGPLAEALHAAGIDHVSSPLFDPSGHRRPRPDALASLVETVRKLAPDLLHGNSLAMGRLTGAVASQLAIPCTAHLRDIIKLSRTAVDDLNGNARLIAVSRATWSFHVEQSVKDSKIVVVHNGIDPERFRPAPGKERLRRELGLPEDASVVLTVGQIGLRKGWDVLAQAMPSVAGRFQNLHLVLVGRRYSDKPETIAYERAVRATLESAMPGRAHFLGERDDVPALMNACDLLVHPARQEPFGRVLLEAAASGLPVVATDVGGTPELVEHGTSAHLVPPGDAAALTQAVVTMLENPALRSRFAASARERIAMRFRVETAADRLAAVWEDA